MKTWPPNHIVVHQTQEMLLVYTPIYLDHARIIRMQGAPLDVTPPSAACDNANEDMWSAVWTLVPGLCHYQQKITALGSTRVICP